MICEICASVTSKSYTVKEQMFGFKDPFVYHECSSCGCLQIDSVPDNLAKYYPPYYYAFTSAKPTLKRLPFFKRLVAEIRIKRKYQHNLVELRYLKEIGTKVNEKILDFGCGDGSLICALFNQGFENVEGVDMFLPNEIDHGYGVKVHKKEVSELPRNSYDLVMMHHVLEHMPFQKKALHDIYKVLKKDGCLMIRIPVLGYAWERYQENWVQLDAPRHLFLHTIKSMNLLAEDTGFTIGKTFFDSTSFQFLGSEIYEQGLPLCAKEDNYDFYSYSKQFSAEEIENFEKRAKVLNIEHRGDSAVFYLYKK